MEVKRRTAKTLVAKLSSSSEQTRTTSLCELRLISKTDPESRNLIAESGAIPYLSDLLYSPAAVVQENATATLLNVSISSRESLISTRGLLDALSHTLRHPASPAAAQTAAATIFSLLTVDTYRPIIGSKRDIQYALIDMIRNPKSHPRTIKDALKALFAISLYPLNRATLIDLQAVPPLFSLVMNDRRVGIMEDATAVIAQIAGCEEAEDAFRKVCGVRVLVELLDLSRGLSDRTKENAVSGLLNMMKCGRKEVGNYVREMVSGVVNGVSEVAENGSLKGKKKAAELLKLINLDQCGNIIIPTEHMQ